MKVTVGQLKDKLRDYSNDMEVVIYANHNGRALPRGLLVSSIVEECNGEEMDHVLKAFPLDCVILFPVMR